MLCPASSSNVFLSCSHRVQSTGRAGRRLVHSSMGSGTTCVLVLSGALSLRADGGGALCG